MGLVDELSRLDDLHRNGALSEQEFAAAKSKLLQGDCSPADDHLRDKNLREQMASQLAAAKYHNTIAQINREWAIERQNFMVQGRYGISYLPTRAMGISTAVFGGIFGAVWTVMASSITAGAPDVGPFQMAKFAFPLFGVVFTIGAIGYGVYTLSKAQDYEEANAKYRARRRQASLENPEGF